MLIAHPRTFNPFPLHRSRLANLHRLIQQLQREGLRARDAQGDALGGLSADRLDALLAGAPLDDALAREIEWIMHRPCGWLDRRHYCVLER